MHQFAGLSIVDADRDGLEGVGAGGARVGQCAQGRQVQFRHQHHGVVAARQHHLVLGGGLLGQFSFDGCVVPMDHFHEREEQAHRDQGDPRTGQELGDQDDEQHRAGAHQPDRIDDPGAHHPAPRRGVVLVAQQTGPVPDHPDLAQRERDEHPDDVQLDQRGHLGVEGDDRHYCNPGQKQDAVGERQPVTAGVQLPRQVTVLREHRAEHGEPVEGGVGRQDEDQRGHRRDQQESEVEAAEDGLGELGNQGLLVVIRRGAGQLFLRVRDQLDPDPLREHDDAYQQDHRDPAQQQQGRRGVARLGFLKRRHPVADRLDTGQRRAARRERPCHQEREGEADDLTVLGVHLEAGGFRAQPVPQHEDPEQSPADHGEDPDDERIRRDGERQPGLPDAAQVQRRHERDGRDAEDHLVLGHDRDRRADIRHRRCRRNSYGENVIHHQSAGDHQTGGLAEVGRDDLVVATA